MDISERLNGLEAEIAGLRRERRRTRVVAAIAVGMAVLLGAARPDHVFRTQRVEIVDELGQPTAVFDKFGLRMFDSDGTQRLRMDVSHAIPGLYFTDGARRPLTGLWQAPDGGRLRLADPYGNAGVALRTDEVNDVRVFDQRGIARAGLDGDAGLVLTDEVGNPR